MFASKHRETNIIGGTAEYILNIKTRNPAFELLLHISEPQSSHQQNGTFRGCQMLAYGAIKGSSKIAIIKLLCSHWIPIQTYVLHYYCYYYCSCYYYY